MAIQIKGDGTFSIEYEGPYQGLDVEHPETLISDKASPSFNNFMLRNAELRSRPKFGQAILGPVNSSNEAILGITSFQDINGIYHTVTWSEIFLWQYNPSLLPASPWVGLTGTAFNMKTFPISYRTFANSIYYTNNSQFDNTIVPFLAYWNGIDALPVFTQTFGDGSTSDSIAGISKTNSPTVSGSLPGAPAMVGPMGIGARYLGELNNTIILANVSVVDNSSGKVYGFPNLIWWSANGLPLQWDPTVNTSAGFNPFLDVSDQITGLATLGIAGYIFRTFGITQMTPTGSAVTPWEFDHMWASDHGIGNVIPLTIAQYGPTAAFVAEDDVYSLTVTSAQRIGGTARDAIMADLANAIDRPIASIIPKFSAGYVYLTYQLIIPLSGFTRIYVYSFDDKNWEPWDEPGSIGTLWAAPNYV